MIKKLTSILLVVMLLATLTPSTIFAATTTEEITDPSVGHTRAGTGNSGVPQGTAHLYIQGGTEGQLRQSYLAFDLSGREAKILAASEIILYVKCNRYGGDVAQPFNIYILTHGADVVNSDLTYDISKTAGINEGGTLAISSTTTISGQGTYFECNVTEYLKSALEGNIGSKVVFRIDSSPTTTPTSFYYSGHKLSFTYDSDNVDDEAYISGKASTLEWSDISEQSQDSITENLTFPSKLYGADVTWESDDAAVLSDGTVTQLRGEVANVTLTAKLNYNGAEAIKKFELTVPALTTSSKTVNILQKAHIQGTLDKQGINWGEIVCRTGGIGTYDHRVIFYQFDLSGNEAYIDKASGATFSMNAQQSGSTFKVTLLSDSSDNWDEDTLSYQMAYDLGMVTDVGYTFATGASALNGVTYTSPDFSQALKATIAENPANSLITLRIEAESGQIVFKNPKPMITMEYYDEDVDTDAFFAEKKDTLAWENISTQSINNVVAGLDLPSQFYGFDVSWSSSDDTVINSAGEVTVSGTKTPVTLIATITDGTNTYSKAFDVTVSDKAYAIEFSNESGTAAKIYAAEETNAVLVFAAYADSTLLSVAPVNVTLADGENLVNSLLNTTGATEVKLMLVSDMDTLTPLCTSKVK